MRLLVDSPVGGLPLGKSGLPKLPTSMDLQTRLVCAAVWLVVVTIGSLVFVALLRRLFRGLGGGLGSTPRTRLLSVGIACLLFASTIEYVMRTLVRLGLELFVRVPLGILEGPDQNLDRSDAVAAIAARAGRVFSELRLDSLGYAELLLFFAMWAAIAKMIESGDGAGSGEPLVIGRGALGVLIGVGTFLSVASLIATPVLRDTGDLPEKISPDELRKKIVENTPSEVTLKSKYPEDVTGDPFEKLRTALSDQRRKPAQVAVPETATLNPPVVGPAPPPSGAIPVASATPQGPLPQPIGDDRAAPAPPDMKRIQEVMESLDALIDREAQQRQRLLKLWKETRAATLEEQQRASNRALTEFDVGGVGRKGSREAVDHFKNVLEWYVNGIDASLRDLNRCQNAVSSADEYWRDFSLSTARILGTDWGEVSSRVEYFDSQSRLNDPYGVCRSFVGLGEPPTRSSPGYNLGPFSFVATWLLRTESLPLTALIGMFGFGLIGAAMRATAASPARREATALNDVLPNSPVAAIVLRSITAAIVVFLAIQGGLAVASDREASANPYLLYFLCFVAAVFSEEVWLWARGKLLGGLDNSMGEPPPGSGSPEPKSEPKSEPKQGGTTESDSDGPSTTDFGPGERSE